MAVISGGVQGPPDVGACATGVVAGCQIALHNPDKRAGVLPGVDSETRGFHAVTLAFS